MTPQANTTRVTTRTLLLLFVAFLALVIGIFNLRDRVNQKAVMTDGAVWRDDPQFGIVADKIETASPATRAGVWRGDILIGISPTGNRDDMEEVRQAQDVQIYIDQAKDRSSDPGKAYLSYWVQHRNDAGDTLLRDGIADVELTARTTHDLRGLYLALIGLIYLGIGVYFLLRQGRAPYATHFFLLCLLAFIAHFYSPTEELRAQFDKAIDLADAIALILLGPMFMHFAAIYPERDIFFRNGSDLRI